MTINKPHLVTNMPIWQPKWSARHSETKEEVVLLKKDTVNSATPIFTMHFTKYPKYANNRYCMTREKAQSYPITEVKSKAGNVVPMYTVPLSHFEHWETAEEVRDVALSIWDD